MPVPGALTDEEKNGIRLHFFREGWAPARVTKRALKWPTRRPFQATTKRIHVSCPFCGLAEQLGRAQAPGLRFDNSGRGSVGARAGCTAAQSVNGCGSPAPRWRIAVLEPAVKHTGSVQQVERWLDDVTTSPAEWQSGKI